MSSISTISEPTSAPRKHTLAELRRWLSKGAFAIIDQGFISGSNFVLGILLARWLGADQYGAYAMAFATFVLLSLVYQSLLLEPMSVYGPSAYGSHLREYTGTLIWIHVAIAVFTFAIMALAAWAISGVARFAGLSSALIGAAAAAPCVLLFWLARRAFYLKLSSSEAAIGAVIYSAVMFGTLALLHHWHIMSPMVAFLLMAFAALVTSAYLLVRFRPSLRKQQGHLSLNRVARENWTYGRWALASAAFMWIPWNIFYTLVGSFSGMNHAGQLRALLNFALPAAQTFGALSLLFLPQAACKLKENSDGAMAKISNRITLLFGAAGAGYWLIVIVFRTPILDAMYSGQYNSVGAYIPVIGLASICWGAAQGPAIALRANKSPHAVFVMYSIAAVVALGVGVPATLRFGLAGACAAILFGSLTALITGTVCTRRPQTRVAVLESAA